MGRESFTGGRESFSRGYLHHLLSLNELLATLSLARHNLCRMWKLMDSIRKAIKDVDNGGLRGFRERYIDRHTGLRKLDKAGAENQVFVEVLPLVEGESDKIGTKAGIKEAREMRKGEGGKNDPPAK